MPLRPVKFAHSHRRQGPWPIFSVTRLKIDRGRKRARVKDGARRRKKLWKVSVRNSVNLAISEMSEIWLAHVEMRPLITGHVYVETNDTEDVLSVVDALRHAWLNVISKDSAWAPVGSRLYPYSKNTRQIGNIRVSITKKTYDGMKP